MQRPHYMIGSKRQLLEEAAGRHSVELCSEWEAFPRNQLINYLAFSHAPVGTCRGQRSMPIVFPSHSPHNAFKQDLLLNQALTFGGRLTDQKAPGTPFFLLPFPSPSPRVIGVCCHAQCIYGNLGSKFTSSGLCNRHFTLQAISPASCCYFQRQRKKSLAL